ncbi:MAG: hypothetical protein IT372_36715 [Polyangiaceae bacterium]|nr:hypothetical protein [Polyangiaceae bacterium]
MSDDTNDNDITRFRVYYDDSDGRGNQAAVRVQLLRWVGGRMELIPGSFWSSNQRAETRGFTVGYHSLPYDLQGDSLYSFMVVMYRRSAENTAGFAGIDFPFIPPPFEGPARPIR